MDVRMKKELIEALRRRTDQLEKAFAEDDLDQIKAMEMLIEANMGTLSDIIDRMEK